MKNAFLMCLLFVFIMACSGESKKIESSEKMASPESNEESTPKISSESAPENIEAVETSVDDLNQKTEELNNDLDSLLNEI